MTTRNTQTIQVKPLSMRAAIQTVDPKARTATIMWSTGEKVLRHSWMDGSFYEELSMDPAHVRMGRMNNGAPLLLDHNQRSVAGVQGVVESASISNGKGTAVVRFAAEGIDPETDKIFRKVQDGIIRKISVGYRTFKLVKVEAGQGNIPTFRAEDWEPHEVSMIAVGAEDGAGFRELEQRSAEPTNACEVISTRALAHNPKEGKQMDPEELKRKQEQEAREAAALAERQAADLAVATRAVQADRTRTADIRHAVKAAGLPVEFGDKLIANDKITVDAARAAVIGELATRSETQTEQPQHQPTTGGETSHEKFIRGASAWLIEKSGAKVVERAHELAQSGKLGGSFRLAKTFKEIDLDGGEFRGMSMFDLARESLERRGVKIRGLDKMQVASLALNHRATAYAPASDFAVLFENVMHKTLLGAYATQPDQWSKFCKVDSVPDFRESNRFRVGSFGALDVVPPGTEYKNKAIPDGLKSTISTETKGNIIALSREAIINDDMNANVDVAARFGRGARLGIEIEVFDLLAENGGLGPTMADGQPFFHSANRANVGAGETISVAALDKNYQVMQAQRDMSSNEYLDIKPAYLLVNSALRMTANRLNTAEFDNDGTALMQPNGVRGMFREVIDTPRIASPIRYLFADPGIAPAIVVAFLQGSGEAPTLEQQLGWRIDGIEWKARMDFKAQVFDPKGAVYDDGAT